MKMNKFTSALLALGLISLAGAAQANTTIYLTGSTAARSIIFAAATTAGQIFTGAGVVVSPAPNNTSSANTIVFEGNITGLGVVDLNCSFTGSEAGIAAVAGQSLSQTLNYSGSPVSYTLPGVGSSLKFLTAPGYTTLAALAGAPDLAMADSSQAVSQTPKSLFNLKDFGLVGIVPFTVQKGYSSSPSTSWTHLSNVTTAQLNQNLFGPLNANIYTGVASDADVVVICGRNLGSGTRVNSLLNFEFPLSANVDQFAWSDGGTTAELYPTAGVLTFNGHYTSQQLTEVFNDGFDGGSGVQKSLNVDGAGSGAVVLGYVGLGDASTAAGHGAALPTGAGAATYLPFNGVYESDSAVINGNYPFWGQEHLIGQVTPTATQTTVANAIKAGIAAQLVSSGAGTKTGAVAPTYTAQSALIPVSAMQVSRGTDAGFPVQAPF